MASSRASDDDAAVLARELKSPAPRVVSTPTSGCRWSGFGSADGDGADYAVIAAAATFLLGWLTPSGIDRHGRGSGG